MVDLQTDSGGGKANATDDLKARLRTWDHQALTTTNQERREAAARIEALEAALKLATVIDANHVAAGNRLAEALAHLIEFTDMTGQGCAAQQVAARVDLAAWRATEKGETNGNG